MKMENISKAIVQVMNEVNGVAKNMTVGSGNNSYKGVSDKDVKLAIRESMIKNGLSILPTSLESKVQIDRWEEDDTFGKQAPFPKKTKQSCFTEVNTKYLLLHTSGESLELSGYGQGVDTQDKGAGKATTYALKNTLLNMFLIPTGVDTDNTHSDEYDVPKAKPKYEDNENPWISDKDLANMEVELQNGEVISKSALKQDYKISKANQEKIVALIAKYPGSFTA